MLLYERPKTMFGGVDLDSNVALRPPEERVDGFDLSLRPGENSGATLPCINPSKGEEKDVNPFKRPK